MPFIEENELAALYKEVDKERQSAIFFQDLHQKNKKSLTRLTFYKRWGYLSLSALVLLGLIFIFFFTSSNAEVDTLRRKVKQLQIENELVGNSFSNTSDKLKNIRVFTVQIAASKKDELLLFSEHFVNFRAHSMQGFNAYSLGNFSTQEEANAFKEALHEIGLKDAWVTSYLNGKRIILENE